MELVAKAPADGYTLGTASGGTHGANATLYGSKLPFDPVRDFTPITMLAEMKIRIEATSLLVRKAAWGLDKGIRDPMTSSCAKAFGADGAVQSALDAVQVFGGYGYVKDYPVEKLMRDAKILQIYEPTAQVQRLVIARALVGR